MLFTYYYNLFLIYNKARIFPILYIDSLSFFLDLRAGILKIPGNKFKAKGYIKDNRKQVNVFIIRVICVFL